MPASADRDDRQTQEALSAVSANSVTSSGENGWSSTGNLTTQRALHTATRLQDGRVLVVGGWEPSAELYDPATGTWSRTGNAPGNYRRSTATLLPSGKVLVTGAPDSGVSAALYNPASGSWTATAGLATPRFHHTATLLPDGRVLVTGGADSEYDGNAKASAELYDPATGSWTAAAAMHAARSEHTATLLSSGKVLVAGGRAASGRLASAELYDPVADVWTIVSPMATARAYHVATALPSGDVLITGGAQDGAPAATAELYDPDSQSWSAAHSMNQPRRRHTATLLPSGKVLVAGGYDDTTGIQTGAELYDPLLDTWHVMDSMSVDRYHHSATLLASGQVLVAGGASNGNQASAELFSAAYLHFVIDQGPRWQLVNVSSASTDGNAQPYNTTMYIIDGQTGVANAPLPEELRNELAQGMATEEKLYFIDKETLDDLVSASAISQDESAQASLFLCPEDELVHTTTDAFTFAPGLAFSQDLGGGFTGTVDTSGELRVTAYADVDMWLKRADFLCLPYLEYEALRFHGDGSLHFGGTLSGTLSYQDDFVWNIVDVDIPIVVIPIGPFTIPLNLHLPIAAGVTIAGSVTGSITYAAQQSASVHLDIVCTREECSSQTTFQPLTTSQENNIGAGISGRGQPSIWARVAPRLYLGTREAAYVQVEARAYLNGDLWGFTGTNCGDADGNGHTEWVQASTLDIDSGVGLHAELGILGIPKRFDNIAGRQWHLGFWNLEGSISPVLLGPSSTPRNLPTSYQLKMRPCWPYGDTMNYHIDWGDGTTGSFSGAPGSALTVTHVWGQDGPKQVTAHATIDAHTRTPTGAVTRNVTVDPVVVDVQSSQFVSQSVPILVQPAQPFIAAMRMHNNGTTTWSPATHFLGSQNPQDNATWGRSRVALPHAVAPGEEVTFELMANAPTAAGVYNFQWQMLEEGVAWFGEPTANISVNVSEPEPEPECDLSACIDFCQIRECRGGFCDDDGQCVCIGPNCSGF